jgi:hypothetical protein
VTAEVTAVVGRWERPVPIETPPAGVAALAAALTFLPTFVVIEYFLDLGLAITGAACLARVAMPIAENNQGAPPDVVRSVATSR